MTKLCTENYSKVTDETKCYTGWSAAALGSSLIDRADRDVVGERPANRGCMMSAGAVLVGESNGMRNVTFGASIDITICNRLAPSCQLPKT
jgi:hypothetical protein